jgi:spore coat protein U-like protein
VTGSAGGNLFQGSAIMERQASMGEKRSVPSRRPIDGTQDDNPCHGVRTTIAIAAIAAIAMLIALPFGTAWAADKQDCDAQIEHISRIEPSSDYDPYGGASMEYHQVTVRLRKADGPECMVMLGADEGRFGRRVMDGRLVYDLYKDSRLSQRLGDIDGPADGLFVATLSQKNEEASFQFFSYIPSGQVVGKGVYLDQVNFNLYALRDGAPTGPIASHNVQVKARVRGVVSASVIVNGVNRPLSGTVGQLDLGELSNGATAQFSLDVNGNADYTLSLSSENGGRLVSRETGSGIDYSLAIGGRTLSLRNGASTVLGGSGRYDILVQAQGQSDALAGSYQDNLILSISAQ